MKRKKQPFSAFQKQRKIQEKSDAVFEEIRASTIPRQPRLLALPVELRNSIYGFALVGKEPIDLDSNRKEPSFLLVNRQIRTEARRTYYTGNQFAVVIQDCNDDLLHKFAVHCKFLDTTDNVTILLRVNPAKNWTNLYKWCEHAWNNDSVGPSGHQSGDSGICTVVVAAHTIVCQHRDGGRSWSECVLGLENLKAVAEKLDPGWT